MTKAKRKENENKVILKQWVRVFILIVTIAVMITSIVSIAKSLNPEVIMNKKLYSYNYNSGMNYKVYLKNNSFFTSPYMPMNKQYITSIIDHIEVEAKYDFTSDTDLAYDYSYSIKATARGMAEDSDGKKIDVWSKEYPLVPETKNTGTGRKVTISKTFNVDYNYYNQVLTDFRNQFGLSVDARVDVTFNVKINGGMPGAATKSLQENKSMTLQMPLLVQTLKIKPDFVNNGGDTVYEKLDDQGKKIDVNLLVIGVLLLAVSIIVLIKVGKSLLVVTRKSEYILAVNKILKDYGDIIAETHNMPDLNKYDIVNIKNFVDMVDIEEELHSPIIYFEIEEDSKCVFLILNENTAYRFLLKESDFDHFNAKSK
ncbi:MAG: DUF5305 domain-containing protein [Bacilli bacterium]|nr:DUF5305 domain-containing protein [Bacilli bacterium]